ncbi:flagellar basal body-associated FliL family protein [Alkalilacustris brevis]|uniref:flagellar basal body-associated FliL family protein n=1 Tax=Alkalilacustris brevis TaxID=2026338 RepID=UPI001EE3D6BB|nr:flagellar basal body-associated FliL family protein [Alkalilacustris brevis]
MLPILLALLGLAGGIGAGLVLSPGPAPAPGTADAPPTAPAPGTAAEGRDYVRLNNQFIVPVLTDGKISAMVILAVGIETAAGETALVRNHEPRLRDIFLQTLFEHSNAGGFSGHFTASAPMHRLRSALREAAQSVLGPAATDVLIIDLMRQDN